MVYVLWQTVREYLRKLKIELSYIPEIPLLGISKELKSGSQRDIINAIFIAVLFTIAKMWKQPKYYQQINQIRKCDIYIQQDTNLSLKKKKIL